MPGERGVVTWTKSLMLAVHIPHPAAAHREILISSFLCVAKDTAKEVIFMKNLVACFQESARELKEHKTIVVTAMMIALGVVLGFYSVQIGDFLKIGFSGLANELTAMLFGPVVGGLMGGIADLLKFIIRPTGPFFFGFTFNAILAAVIYGVFWYKKPMSLKRIFAAKITVAIVVNLFLNTYWLSMLYGKGFAALLPARAIKQLISVPVESILFFLVVSMLMKAKVFGKLKA